MKLGAEAPEAAFLHRDLISPTAALASSTSSFGSVALDLGAVLPSLRSNRPMPSPPTPGLSPTAESMVAEAQGPYATRQELAALQHRLGSELQEALSDLRARDVAQQPLSLLEERVLRLERKAAELTGTLKGFGDEAQRQVRRIDSLDHRLLELRHRSEAELEDHLAEFEAKVAAALSGISLGSSEDIDIKVTSRTVVQSVSDIRHRLERLEAAGASMNGPAVDGEAEYGAGDRLGHVERTLETLGEHFRLLLHVVHGDESWGAQLQQHDVALRSCRAMLESQENELQGQISKVRKELEAKVEQLRRSVEDSAHEHKANGHRLQRALSHADHVGNAFWDFNRGGMQATDAAAIVPERGEVLREWLEPIAERLLAQEAELSQCRADLDEFAASVQSMPSSVLRDVHCQGTKEDWPLQQQAAYLPCIALDFDHTLTARHIYKALGPGYYNGQRDVHADSEDFATWCLARQLPTSLPEERRIDEGYAQHDDRLRVHAVLDYFDHCGCTRELFREFFMGGEDRIDSMTRWLRDRAATCQLLIVTAGFASVVVRLIASAMPEWASLLPAGAIQDVHSQRWLGVSSVLARKLLTVRDVRPLAAGVLLVDDAASSHAIPPWALKVTKAQAYNGLEFEAGGLQEMHLRAVTALVNNLESGRSSIDVAVAG